MADDWLKSLNDPLLDAIVAEAIANNLDLRQAAERVTIAQQSVIVVGAQLLPQVGAVLGGRTTNDEDHATNSNSTLAYAGVAWEIDVWGKLRAQRAAAVEGYAATALDYAYARQSLAATVCKTWYLAIETRQLLALAEQAVDIYRQLLELVTNRRQAGKDSDLDVVDTRAKLETAMSELERARESYGEARRALEVLLGRYPAAEIEVAAAYPILSAPRRRGCRRRCSSAGPTSLPRSARYWRPFARRKRRSSRCCPISPSRWSAGVSAIRFSRCCISIRGSPRRPSALPFRSTKAAHCGPRSRSRLRSRRRRSRATAASC